MILKLKRTPGLYLVGFMGSGKTTVGRIVAAELGWAFVDIDDDIEREQKQTISSIFERHGEAEFRRHTARSRVTRSKWKSCITPAARLTQGPISASTFS